MHGTHLMLDLETLSTRPDAAFVQIGAVAFTPTGGPRPPAFSCYVRPHAAAHIDPDTVRWWLVQSHAARTALAGGMGDGVDEAAALDRLDGWVAHTLQLCWSEVAGVWSHGATFDLPILASAYARAGRAVPWRYPAARDTRTLFALATADGQPPEVERDRAVAHDAADDAVVQARQVQQAMALLQDALRAAEEAGYQRGLIYGDKTYGPAEAQQAAEELDQLRRLAETSTTPQAVAEATAQPKGD